MFAPHVPFNTLTATHAFAKRIAQAYPTQKAILFGSRARGIRHDESDADVAIILNGEIGVRLQLISCLCLTSRLHE